MSQAEEQIITGNFDISDWNADTYAAVDNPSQLSRVKASKVFTGDIDGSSTAELLMAGNDRGAGYVASEVFSGSVAGRSGTMIVQHWGIAEGTAAASSGHIIPGSGTGELSNISGKAIYSQDATGQHQLELRVTFSA